MTDTTRLTCTCGQLAVDVEGPPILSVECCCTSCRAAAAILEQRPGAPKILGAHGTTPFVMYRKDRIRWAAGTADLREHRLSPDAPTRLDGFRWHHTRKMHRAASSYKHAAAVFDPAE